MEQTNIIANIRIDFNIWMKRLNPWPNAEFPLFRIIFQTFTAAALFVAPSIEGSPRLNIWSTPNVSQDLRRMRFLTQPSHFIWPWGRHCIQWCLGTGHWTWVLCIAGEKLTTEPPIPLDIFQRSFLLSLNRDYLQLPPHTVHVALPECRSWCLCATCCITCKYLQLPVRSTCFNVWQPWLQPITTDALQSNLGFQ